MTPTPAWRRFVREKGRARRAELVMLPAAVMLLAGSGSASLIMDRAPEARAVAEIFVDRASVRTVWEIRNGDSPPALEVTPDRRRLPSRLTLSPPAGIGAKELAVVVYHRGLPVSDLNYLTKPEVIDLNWDDPWRSRFRNPALRRAYDSPMGVFLHVDRYQVRVEVIGRPVDFGLARIDPNGFATAIERELRGRWSLRVDGVTVDPGRPECRFLERRLRTTRIAAPPPPDAIRAATLGVVYSLSREQWPQRVTLEWRYFPPGLDRLSASITEDEFMEPSVLRRGRNTLEWKRGSLAPETVVRPVPAPAFSWQRQLAGLFPTSVALLAGLLGWAVWRWRRRSLGRPQLLLVFLAVMAASVAWSARRSSEMSGARAGVIAGELLSNVYHSFEFPNEGAVYDALATSVSGDLLTEVYLQIRKALELERTGGARIKVKTVQVESAVIKRVIASGGFVARCRWLVTGSVAHWGHVHTRRNRYEARLRVVASGGVWKIEGLTILDQKRLPR